MTFGVRFATPFCLILLAVVLSGCKTPTPSIAPHPTQPLHYEPAEVELVGTILKETFPGAPNYESVAKGDALEEYWILTLDKPIDVAGLDDMSPAETNVQKLQLVLGEGDYQKYLALLNRAVVVKGTLFHQITVHHKTPVLIEVKRIELAK